MRQHFAIVYTSPPKRGMWELVDVVPRQFLSEEVLDSRLLEHLWELKVNRVPLDN